MKVYLRYAIIAGLVLLCLAPEVIPRELLPVGGAASALQLGFVFSAVLYGLTRRDISTPLRYLLNRYVLAVLVLWILLLSFLLISDNLSYGLSKSMFFFAKSILPLVALAMLAPFDQRDLRVVFAAIVSGSVLTIASLLVFGDFSAERVTSGDEEHPITLARQISLGATCLLVSALSEAGRGRIRNALSVGVAVPMLFAASLTGSRGPLLAVGFAILGVFFFAGFGVRHRFRVVWRLGLISSLLLVALSYSSFELPAYASLERIGNYTMTVGENTSDVARIDRAETALDGFVASYGVGVGTGSFASLYGVRGRDYPHDVFLEAMVEQGVIGLLAVVAILAIALARLARLVRVPGTHYEWLMAIWFFTFFNALISGDVASNYQLWITGGVAWFVRTPAVRQAVTPVARRAMSIQKASIRR